MTSPIPFTLTNQSLTVIVGGKPTVVQSGTTQFNALRDAVLASDWEAVPGLLSQDGALSKWIGGEAHFSVLGETVQYDGRPLPPSLQKRVWAMANKAEDPRRLFRFYERLQLNPSFRSVQQLFDFLEHQHIPFTENGCFLAYKGVNENFTDCHTGEIANEPGAIHEMPRNLISDDPREACHYGFHVGALSYASGFGPRTVVCKVDPADVVCVPYDESAQKMRVCKYEVIGHHTSDSDKTTLPSTSISPEEEEGAGEFEDSEDSDEQEDELDPDNVIGDAMNKAFAAGEIDATGRPKAKPSKARKFGRLDAKGLIKESIADLRQYAKKLKIIGASKLPGGKSALIARIIRVRRGRKR